MRGHGQNIAEGGTVKEDLKRIHDVSMRILDETGVKFHHPKVLEILRQNGIRIKGQTAYFTEDQVMNWIQKAPETFTIYARNPKYNMVIGGDHTEYAPGYGAPTIIENDGSRRPGLLKDYVDFTKLIQVSECFNANGGILIQPSDIEPEKSSAVMVYTTLILSDKCVIGIEGLAEQVQVTLDLVDIVLGREEGLTKNPRMLTILNTLSPLQFDHHALDTMLLYAQWGQAVVVTPCVMGGAIRGPLPWPESWPRAIQRHWRGLLWHR